MTKFKTYRPAGVKDPYGTYVHAMEPIGISRMLFIAGQTPVRRDGTVPKDMTGQATVCWQNIKDILEDAQLSMSNLVRTTMYITDRKLYAEADAVSALFLEGHRTPAACVEVSSLIEKDWLIEVEGIAVAP